MYPTLNHDLARHRQADLRREGAQARLAREATAAAKADEQLPISRFNLNWRRRAVSFGRPVLGHH